MNKHTPGPWNTRPAAASGAIIIQTAVSDIVAFVHHSPLQRDANASLIGAAPDLLAAIEAMLPMYSGQFGEDCEEVITAREAIAKARGGV